MTTRPDKVPARRLQTIEEAGKQKVPFTTGLLIGIGETPEDRVDTLLAIRDLHRRYGHIQEVIVQNFRVKPAIPMASGPSLARRNAADGCGGAAADAGNEHPGAAEFVVARLRRAARGRHQRLGRGFAAHAGFHQPEKRRGRIWTNSSGVPRPRGAVAATACQSIRSSLPAVAARRGLHGGEDYAQPPTSRVLARAA